MSTGLSSSLNWVTFKSEDVQKAREIFNSLERTRCEAIGSNEMAGVAKNLNQMEKTKLKRKELGYNFIPMPSK